MWPRRCPRDGDITALDEDVDRGEVRRVEIRMRVGVRELGAREAVGCFPEAAFADLRAIHCISSWHSQHGMPAMQP